jgi:hypothetical protein
MTITSQGGIFGFGLQDDGAKGGGVQTWHRHMVTNVAMAPVVEKDVPPPEISGANVTTGSYVSGTYYAGRASLIPRLKNVFGHLLLGGFGAVTSESNATTGFTNTFHINPTYPIFIPFMRFRRLIPGRDALSELGEMGIDAQINTMTFNFPQVGPITFDFDVTGREWELDEAPDLWAWSAIPEPFESVPMVMKGSGITLPDLALLGGKPIPANNARITINNNTTTVREERIIGSYFPDDFATRQRTAEITLTYKWADQNFYRFVLNGGDPAIADFQPCIPNSSFNVEVETPCDIQEGVINYPWKLRINAEKVSWQASPLTLSQDDILTFDVTGTVLLPDDGDVTKYIQAVLFNEYDSYAIPTS